MACCADCPKPWHGCCGAIRSTPEGWICPEETVEDSIEKRILLAFALSFVVLFVFTRFLAPPVEAPPQPVAEQEPSAEATQPPAAVAAPESLPQPGVQPAPEQGEAQAGEQETIQADFAGDVSIETSLYGATIANEGGQLRSLRLPEYEGELGTGMPLELVNPETAQVLGWPLAIETGDLATDEAIRTGLHVVERNGDVVRSEYAADGLYVRREIAFGQGGGYLLEVTAEVRRDGQPVDFSLVLQGEFGDQSESIAYDPAFANVVYLEQGEFERLNVTGIEGPQPLIPTTLVGIEDRFFLAMFMVPEGTAPVADAAPLVVEGESVPMARLRIPYPGTPVTIYVGPKQETALADADPFLVPVIDYGFFEILARPLLLGLMWINGYVGNYGWSIIVLTLFINIILFPLRLKSQLSMMKMSKIQPQMRTFQDQLKKLKANDPRKQEIQAEMMGLYKKHGVNPVGGCVPMLLQMPFLFAIFSLLRTSIEIRHAPWMLWIHDLSAPDAYYVLPVLMGASMFVMQKMTPTIGDPAQARMMMMMPVMLSGMFILFPVSAGLMLYWLTSNVVGVGQQYFIRTYWAPEDTGKKGKRKGPKPETIEVSAEVVSAAADRDDESGEDAKRRRRKGRRK